MPQVVGVAEAGQEVSLMLGRGGPSPCAVSVQRTAEHLQQDGETEMSKYAELLRDPRWQKKRLEVLEAAGWTCASCFDDKTELHVHHLRYKWNAKPWEYSNDELSCLCKNCHSKETEAWSMLKDELMLLGLGAKVLVPLVAGYMAGFGFISEEDDLLSRADAMDGEMVRVGRTAARIERLPDDLAANVQAAIDAAVTEYKRRLSKLWEKANA